MVAVRVRDRPADGVLPWLLIDARHARARHRADFRWIRPLDVAAMLVSARAPSTACTDLTLGVATLGSAYLGGYPVRTLAAAGLIDEHTPGGLDRADVMFRSPVPPWWRTWF